MADLASHVILITRHQVGDKWWTCEPIMMHASTHSRKLTAMCRPALAPGRKIALHMDSSLGKSEVVQNKINAKKNPSSR